MDYQKLKRQRLSRRTSLMQDRFHYIRSIDNTTLSGVPGFVCLEDLLSYSFSELERLKEYLEYKQRLLEHDLTLIELYFDEFYNPF